MPVSLSVPWPVIEPPELLVKLLGTSRSVPAAVPIVPEFCAKLPVVKASVPLLTASSVGSSPSKHRFAARPPLVRVA